jgi:hypothetical protein
MTQITQAELVKLCAVDNRLFAKTFFPKTARMVTPPFVDEIWMMISDPFPRYVCLWVFRGGAKTSVLRMFTAKRIGYGISHTILYIGKSEGHAVRSVKWIKRQVQYNHLYRETFQLRRGDKWQDTEAEIWHGTDEYPVWIMGAGITGSIRGINEDDYRPDLIIIDDVIDEENSATPEQREKIDNLILGALKESLAPVSEAPHAKIVMLQTPLNREDASAKAQADPEWVSARFGCWTADTEDAELARRESRWPERWTSETLRKEKTFAIRRNKLSLFTREKECKLTSPETSAFKPEWLQYYDLLPETMTVAMAIDPVPPPSDLQIAKGMKGKDYEALAVVGLYKGQYFLLDYSANRGHDPSWTVTEFFRLAIRWKPRVCVVESVAYQRTLAWLIREAMKSSRRYYVIKEMTDKRSKYDRIVDSLSGPTFNSAFYCKESHTEFISQFSEYPDVNHEDILEAVAVATAELSTSYEEDYDDILEEEDDIPALTYVRGAP